MKDSIRSLKKQIKGSFRFFTLYIRYVFHWILLAQEIGRYRRIKKQPPVLLCMANPGSVGGTELQIQIIAEALKARLGDCLVLISGKAEGGKNNLFLQRLQSLKIPYLQLKSLGLILYDEHPLLKKGTAYLLAKAVKDSKICHFFNPSSTVLTPVIKSLGLSNYYMETGMPVSDGWWKILHTTIGHFNYFTSVSLAGLRNLKLYYGCNGPSAVTPSMFHLPPGHFLCRPPLKDVYNIVYFGRMTRGKGVDLLIEAFCQLIQTFPYAKLTLIGSGERLSFLQNWVQKLGLTKQIEFTGWLQNSELFSRLVDQDLFCLPSFSEGLPSSILEAMSIGLPVVATSVGGIPEIIEHDVSGIIIPPHDLNALTNILLELAEAPLRRMRLREEGFLRLKKVGAPEVVLNQLLNAYQLAAPC